MPPDENNLTRFWSRLVALWRINKLKNFTNSLQHFDITIVKNQSSFGAMDLEAWWRVDAWQDAFPEDLP